MGATYNILLIIALYIMQSCTAPQIACCDLSTAANPGMCPSDMMLNLIVKTYSQHTRMH